MTRAECEAKLIEHMEAMVEILHQHSPNSTYLCAMWSESENGEFFTINNECFNQEAPDRDTPVYCHKFGSGELISITA